MSERNANKDVSVENASKGRTGIRGFMKLQTSIAMQLHKFLKEIHLHLWLLEIFYGYKVSIKDMQAMQQKTCQ